MRGKSVPISGTLLLEKALQLTNAIEGQDSEFIASGSWLDRWKKEKIWNTIVHYWWGIYVGK